MNVAVVGGGVLGVACAYQLSLQGASVTLYESGGDVVPPESAGWANGCHLATQSTMPSSAWELLMDPTISVHWREAPWGFLRRFVFSSSSIEAADAKRQLAELSATLFDQCVQREQLSCGPCGVIQLFEKNQKVADNPNEQQQKQQPQQQQQRAGLGKVMPLAQLHQHSASFQWLLAGDNLANAQRHFSDRCVWRQQERVCNARTWLRELAAVSQQRYGVSVKLHSRVRSVSGTRVTLEHEDDNDGEGYAVVEYDAVVVCAGVASAALLAADHSGSQRAVLPLAALRGYSVTVPVPAEAHPGMLLDTGFNIGHVYCAVVADDEDNDDDDDDEDEQGDKQGSSGGGKTLLLRVAGIGQLGGPELPRQYETLVAPVQQLLPWVDAKHPGARLWTGLRPVLPDNMPAIGAMNPEEDPSLFVCTGHGTLGWTLCMGSAYLIAQQVLGKRPLPMETLFDPRRFA